MRDQMPQKAIILDYLEDQDEPSKPFNQIFVLSRDTEMRNRALGQLWYETFVGDGTPEDYDLEDFANIAIAPCETYADLCVGDGPYLFVTFLDKKNPERVLSGDADDADTDWGRAKRAARGG